MNAFLQSKVDTLSSKEVTTNAAITIAQKLHFNNRKILSTILTALLTTICFANIAMAQKSDSTIQQLCIRKWIDQGMPNDRTLGGLSTAKFSFPWPKISVIFNFCFKCTIINNPPTPLDSGNGIIIPSVGETASTGSTITDYSSLSGNQIDINLSFVSDGQNLTPNEIKEVSWKVVTRRWPPKIPPTFPGPYDPNGPGGPFDDIPWLITGQAPFKEGYWNINADLTKYDMGNIYAVIVRITDKEGYVRYTAFAVPLLKTPREISVQGTLIDKVTNKSFPDGKYPAKLTIYSDSATAIYEQSFSGDSSMQVNNGVFNTILGPIPSYVTFNEKYQLGISVNNQPEMMPRIAFTSVPYAMNAQRAERISPLAAVTGLNGLTGNVQIQGAGNISVVTSDSNKTITISGSGSGGSGIQEITSNSGQIKIVPPTGSSVDLSIGPNSITRSNLARDAVGTKNSATIDFDSLAAGGMEDRTIPVSGAEIGGIVVLGIPNAAMQQGAAMLDVCYTAWVSSPGMVTVRCKNQSSGSINPDAGAFRVMVMPFP